MQAQRQRRTIGQSIIETVVGIIFLVPIVLFLFDVAVLVLANTANDNLAKQAARAAASAVQTDSSGNPVSVETGYPDQAWTAAKTVCSQFKQSGFISHVEARYMAYNSGKAATATRNEDPQGLGSPPSISDMTTDPGNGNVAVVTAIRANAPVPFPGIGTTRVFWARAVEPIVALPP